MIRSTPIVFALMAVGFGAAPGAQEPATTLRAYIVTVGETTLTLANIPIGGASGGGQVFVMAAPKDGASAEAKQESGPPPTWVASPAPKPDAGAAGSGKPMTMRVVTGDAAAKLVLTELSFVKGTVKAADYPADTHVVVTYRADGTKKILERMERAPQP